MSSLPLIASNHFFLKWATRLQWTMRARTRKSAWYALGRSACSTPDHFGCKETQHHLVPMAPLEADHHNLRLRRVTDPPEGFLGFLLHRGVDHVVVGCRARLRLVAVALQVARRVVPAKIYSYLADTPKWRLLGQDYPFVTESMYGPIHYDTINIGIQENTIERALTDF